ncbi:esterase/lipase family protein [Simplicispira hankyongi]|uniref:Triacylglycerol lipase n=1 Tax=Simplicispira hankyongi TaxID=2315688 RepID=A0A398C8T6_9BURK|nr:triacylglycerol lipase [Simplicispira hankyongi]RID97268.1 triacylglycerol lipase [Simplicispira hankyongi]
MTAFFRQLPMRWFFALVLLCATALPATAASTYAQTRYPIVLVHGLFGFDSVFGIDYFYGIPSNLRQNGAQVYVAQVSAANSTEVRGEQLLAQVRNILAITGAAKVNLIGHSHGGPTARYVAGVAPQLVASVTSVGGVNRGSRVADVLRGVAPAGSVGETIAQGAAGALVTLINLASGGSGLPQMPTAALDSLTTAGSARFNQRFGAGVPTSGCGNGAELVAGVRYYSWTGKNTLTNVLDPSDAALFATGLVFGEANDGLVAACSAHLGRHLGDYRQNHLDEINQMVGLRDWFSPDPVTLYREQAHRLKNAGL